MVWMELKEGEVGGREGRGGGVYVDDSLQEG